MTRFNFLAPPRRSLAELLTTLEILPTTPRARTRLAWTAAILLLASAVEGFRGMQTFTNEQGAIARLSSDERSMSDLRSAVNTLSTLSAAEHEIRAIQSSGTRKATELAEIGDRLPQNVGLLSIEESRGSFILHGIASNYEQIGASMERLTRSRNVDSPLLLSSNSVENQHVAAIDFSILLRERTP